jgi:hypothetical protein
LKNLTKEQLSLFFELVASPKPLYVDGSRLSQSVRAKGGYVSTSQGKKQEEKKSLKLAPGDSFLSLLLSPFPSVHIYVCGYDHEYQTIMH